MDTTAKTSNELVDEFVTYLNKSGFQPKFPDEIPEELRTSNAEHGMVKWQVRAASSNPWVQELAQKLPQSWPKAFQSLIDRYRFCNFEVGPLMIFANTGQELFYELSGRVFKDRGMFPVLHQNGFLQFGIPHETNYDPVCFDMKHRSHADAPIKQLDHEEILIRGRVRVVNEIAPSFAQFMRRTIDEKLSVS